MSQTQSTAYCHRRMRAALDAVRNGIPVVLMDDGDRENEADLIVAKHRNGPTATVTVAHQLHYSRFKDLAAM